MGKSKRGGRGGGRKMFIANAEELELRNQQFADQAEARRARRGDSDEEDEDESEDNGHGKSEGEVSVFKVGAERSGDGMAAAMGRTKNPNAGNDPKVAPKMMKLKDLKSMGDALPAADPDAGMTRKQREALDAERKAAEYLKRRMAGETSEAKKDLERLKEVRARREAQKQKREAEGRAPGWTEKVSSEEESDGSDDSDEDRDEDSDSDSENADKARKVSKSKALKASKSGGKRAEDEPASLGAMSKELAEKKKKAAAAPADDEAGGEANVPMLKAMEIKKMNPNELKENLKARNLSIQGSKKDLAKRLQDYENERAS